MINFRYYVPLLATAGLVVVSCDGDGPVGLSSEQRCQLTLSPGSAAPGQEVGVGGVPAEWSDSILHGTVRAGDVSSPVALSRADSGDVRLLVPIHPADPLSGGTVELTVGSGDATCAPARLSVAALPTAPGATEAVATEMEGFVSSVAQAVGIGQEELMGDPATLDPKLLPLAMAQFLLDHPENPNSLRNVLDGTAPVLEGERLDPAILNGLFQEAGVLASLERINATLDSLGAPPPAPSPGADASAARLSLAAFSGTPASITTPEQLDYWMRFQQSMARGQEDVDNALNGIGAALGLAVALPPAWPAAPAALVGGLFLYVNGLMYEGMATLLPSELEPLHVDVPTRELPEDAAEPGYWAKAQLSARSREWVIGWPRVVDGVLVGTGGVFAKGSQAAISKINRLMRDSPHYIGPIVAQMINESMGTVAGAFNTFFGSVMLPRDGSYLAGPIAYGPVDVSDLKYVTAFTTSDGVIELLPEDQHRFRAVAAGQTDLVVRTKPELFAQKSSERRTTIRVSQIVVELDPSGPVELRPGGTRMFAARVSGAEDPAVTWSTSCGTLDAPGGGLAEFTAPAEETTCTLTATHAKRTNRSASAQIRVVDKVIVSIDPASAQVRPATQKQFTATVEGTNDTAVEWSASAGSIDASGLFTAPQDTGTVYVYARSVRDTTATASARVEVQESDVQYEVIDLGAAIIPNRINSAGQIIFGENNRAYLWENGARRDLGTLGANYASPRGINDAGQVVGSSSDASNSRSLSFLWENGAMRDLGLTTSSSAMGINNDGHVVGNAVLELDPRASGYLLADGELRSLGTLGLSSTADGISNTGTVFGKNYYDDGQGGRPYRAYVWKNGQMTDLGAMGGTSSEAFDINDADVVVGMAYYASTFSSHVGFVWRDGVMTEVEGLGGRYGARTAVMGINNTGQMVGSSLTSDGSADHAVLWQNGRVQDLNDLIASDSGWLLKWGWGINDNGWIIGVGTYEGTDHGFLLRPVK